MYDALSDWLFIIVCFL